MKITDTFPGESCFRLAKSDPALPSFEMENDLAAYPWEICVIQKLI